MKRSSPWAISK
jgi:hypothetical protein